MTVQPSCIRGNYQQPLYNGLRSPNKIPLDHAFNHLETVWIEMRFYKLHMKLNSRQNNTLKYNLVLHYCTVFTIEKSAAAITITRDSLQHVQPTVYIQTRHKTLESYTRSTGTLPQRIYSLGVTTIIIEDNFGGAICFWINMWQNLGKRLFVDGEHR